MSAPTSRDVSALVSRAREVVAGDAAAVKQIDAYARRLREPLRIAVAGMVKAGKSTLLNAMIGERIAPTDAGECTRILTWYRHGRTARITVHLRDGGVRSLPIRRPDGMILFDLGELTADEVDWIDVEWPSESLRSTVLIDTPGIGSLSADVAARSSRFLTPEHAPSGADAIVYLLRHVHASDVRFLESFRDTAAGRSQTVNAVAVLSRADEVGSGRIDALLSAARIADRYRADGELRALALDVVPVAGLLAEGARTLREREFAALQRLADLDRDERERLLVSVDRFTRHVPGLAVDVAERRELLARFGLFGVRLGAALVRAGARTSLELSERMVQQSGLLELQRFVSQQFRARATALKMRGVLQSLDALIGDRRGNEARAVRAGIEEVLAGAHDLRELSLLSQLRTTSPGLAADDAREAERLVGGEGTAARDRLRLREDATPAQVRERIETALAHWHDLGAAPLSDRARADMCRLVIRSIEGIASELAGSARARRSGTDIRSAAGPA